MPDNDNDWNIGALPHRTVARWYILAVHLICKHVRCGSERGSTTKKTDFDSSCLVDVTFKPELRFRIRIKSEHPDQKIQSFSHQNFVQYQPTKAIIEQKYFKYVFVFKNYFHRQILRTKKSKSVIFLCRIRSGFSFTVGSRSGQSQRGSALWWEKICSGFGYGSYLRSCKEKLYKYFPFWVSFFSRFPFPCVLISILVILFTFYFTPLAPFLWHMFW